MKKDFAKKAPEAVLNRRDILGLMGATATASLVGEVRARTLGEPATASTQGAIQGAAAPLPSCVVRPQQTEGPYFVERRLNRSDIRSDPSDGSFKPGVPLRLVFRIARIVGNSCRPLSGAVVDVWQCDALGVYSDVHERRFDTRKKMFLRGYQIADTSGTAQFMTIYPGWYPGRTVHIHFKIRTDPDARRGFEFTSQLYFDDAITDLVHAQAPYAGKGQRTVKNDSDGIFRRGGRQLLLDLVKEKQGFVGTFDIGLQTT